MSVGPFAPVRIDVHQLAESMEIRRLARAMKRSHFDVIARLALVWGWLAARWTPEAEHGDAAPCSVVDALLGQRGASDAMVRVGLAMPVLGAPGPCVRIVELDGAPDIRARYSWTRRAAIGNRVKAERRRADAAAR